MDGEGTSRQDRVPYPTPFSANMTWESPPSPTLSSPSRQAMQRTARLLQSRRRTFLFQCCLIAVFHNLTFQHDSTILSVLGSLDLYNSNKQVIPYCTTIMFELYHNDMKGWFVQMHFKNSTADDAVTLQFTIPG